MAAPDPTHTHMLWTFLSSNLAYVVTGLTLVLLSILGILGKKQTANAAKDIILEKPVTHDQVDAKLLKCQIHVTEAFTAAFTEFRKELLDEIRILHKRISAGN